MDTVSQCRAHRGWPGHSLLDYRASSGRTATALCFGLGTTVGLSRTYTAMECSAPTHRASASANCRYGSRRRTTPHLAAGTPLAKGEGQSGGRDVKPVHPASRRFHSGQHQPFPAPQDRPRTPLSRSTRGGWNVGWASSPLCVWTKRSRCRPLAPFGVYQGLTSTASLH